MRDQHESIMDKGQMEQETYVTAEFLKRVPLNGVDAQLGVGLDNSETTGN